MTDVDAPPAPGVVHVYEVSTAAEPSDAQYAVLDADERRRAARFHFDRDRRRFVVSHAALRDILGRCAGRPAMDVAFAVGPRGKPSLAAAPIDVRFNLSHSGDLALVAVALGREVGVDVEEMRPCLDFVQIARRFFAPAEADRLTGLSGDDLVEAFYNCWTRKEAFLKARGLGILAPLDQFEVTLAPGVPARLVSTRFDPAQAARWTLADLPLSGRFKAALAVEGNPCRIVRSPWRHGA